jgi:hypothetical protein
VLPIQRRNGSPPNLTNFGRYFTRVMKERAVTSLGATSLSPITEPIPPLYSISLKINAENSHRNHVKLTYRCGYFMYKKSPTPNEPNTNIKLPIVPLPITTANEIAEINPNITIHAGEDLGSR